MLNKSEILKKLIQTKYITILSLLLSLSNKSSLGIFLEILSTLKAFLSSISLSFSSNIKLKSSFLLISIFIKKLFS